MTPNRVHRIFWPIFTGLIAAFLPSIWLFQIDVDASPLPQTAAIVRVDPATRIAWPGESFTITVRIDQAQSLGGFEFDLGYDRNIVQVVTITVGNFMFAPGRQVITLGPIISNDTGHAAFGAVSYGTGAGPSGSDGILAVIRLTAQNVGSTPLTLSGVQLVSSSGTRQPATAQSGNLSVQSGVGSISGSVTLQGRSNRCDAVLVALDTAPSTAWPCNFTLYGVPAGTHRVSLFHTGYLSTTRSNVIVSAGQTTTLPPVTMRAGDTNGDGKVDIFDLVIVGISYNSQPVSDPRADINGDGTVNIFDLTLLGINYSTHAPTPW